MPQILSGLQWDLGYVPREGLMISLIQVVIVWRGSRLLGMSFQAAAEWWKCSWYYEVLVIESFLEACDVSTPLLASVSFDRSTMSWPGCVWNCWRFPDGGSYSAVPRSVFRVSSCTSTCICLVIRKKRITGSWTRQVWVSVGKSVTISNSGFQDYWQHD